MSSGKRHSAGTAAARTEEGSRDKTRSLTDGEWRYVKDVRRRLLCHTLDSTAALADGNTSARPTDNSV